MARRAAAWALVREASSTRLPLWAAMWAAAVPLVVFMMMVLPVKFCCEASTGLLPKSKPGIASPPRSPPSR